MHSPESQSTLLSGSPRTPIPVAQFFQEQPQINLRGELISDISLSDYIVKKNITVTWARALPGITLNSILRIASHSHSSLSIFQEQPQINLRGELFTELVYQ